LINGPIFNKTDLDLKPFTMALEKAANENPHTLILLGPILNSENKKIESGILPINEFDGQSQNYFEYFENIFIKINEIFKVNS